MQWIVANICQAKVPGTLIGRNREKIAEGMGKDSIKHNARKLNVMEEEQEDKFNFLACAQDRALFYWADIIRLGLVEPGVLSEGLMERARQYTTKH